MLTPWADTLDRAQPLPEYPRPQMVRDSYLNLNGPWSYAITTSANKPAQADGTILVPFSPESELSGVGHVLQPEEYLWYIRTVTLPDGFNVGRVLLHFGAVDQTATVWCNGVELATHTGGYLPFTVDITEVLAKENTILVCVRDATNKSQLPRGKQTLHPHGIWYTPQSGIWQTVWLESVPQNYIRSLHVTPLFDAHQVEITVAGEGQCTIDLEGKRFTFPAGVPAHVPVQSFRPWSPEHPTLYPFSVTLGDDTVYSYFAMRKCSVETDKDGVRRLFLNGKPYFHNGLLDQGYWPDGLYTAPSDDALVYDIQLAKDMGFNMLRKHIKVECDRWYYHCDRLGMLVWQDMPCGGKRYDPLIVSTPLVTGWHLPPFAACTAFSAPSAISFAAIICIPDCRRISRPRSTFVPSSRTISGTGSPVFFAAATMPSAITSHFIMPPKILTKIDLTCASESRISNAASTRSAVALPPTSRKFAGLPPNFWIISIVAMAKPAPLTKQPMLPSKLT